MTSNEAKAAVDNGINQMLEDPEQWKRWASTMAKFHRYSPGNVLLIMSQRPHASQVAGFHAWQGLGRHVEKGEHGITILAPIIRKEKEAEAQADGPKPAQPSGLVGFRTATVFDVAQTQGRPLQLPEPQILDGESLAALVGSLSAAAGAPILMAESSSMGGANGVWSPVQGTITLASDRAPDQQVKTLLHEWAHKVGVPDAIAAQDIHRGSEEIVAETTAFVMAQRMGIDTSQYSIPYVGSWAQGDPQKVMGLAQDVSRRVQEMSSTLEKQAQRDPQLAQALGMPPKQPQQEYEMEA